MEILKTFREITMERNHVKIHNKIQKYVPDLLSVEKVGVFMVDTGNKDYIYTITEYETDDKGIPFITQTAKYPSNIGLTGQAIESQSVVKYHKIKDAEEKKKNNIEDPKAAFLGEVDNYA